MGFNALEYWMGQLAFQISFKKAKPQCADCEHANELIFDSISYYNYFLEKKCRQCPKFDGAFDGVMNWWEEADNGGN